MSLQTKLEEAKDAYHKLQTGTMAVSIMKDGRRIEYNRTNIHQLKNYIDELEAQMGNANTRRRRPAGVIF